MPRDGLALFLHEVVELTTLGRHIFERLLDFGKSDLTGGYVLIYLADGYAEDFGEFFVDRYTTSGELTNIDQHSPALRFQRTV